MLTDDMSNRFSQEKFQMPLFPETVSSSIAEQRAPTYTVLSSPLQRQELGSELTSYALSQLVQPSSAVSYDCSLSGNSTSQAAFYSPSQQNQSFSTLQQAPTDNSTSQDSGSYYPASQQISSSMNLAPASSSKSQASAEFYSPAQQFRQSSFSTALQSETTVSHQDFSQSLPLDPAISVLPSVLQTRKSPKIITTGSEIRSLNRIFTILEEVKVDLNSLRHMFAALGKRLGQQSGTVALPECVKFPVLTYNDLLKLDLLLVQPEVSSSVVSYLSMIGGKDSKDFVRRIMKQIICHELTMSLSWKGSRSVKHSFYALRLVSKIKEAIRKDPIHNATSDHIIEHTISEWLRLAKDREGGRKNRRKQKTT